MAKKKNLKKILLDEEIIDIICEEYGAKKEMIMHLENYSCFSEPDLDKHSCVYSKGDCNFCHKNPILWDNCVNVCQISKVCLAAYLVRSGYKAEEFGGDVKKRMKEALTSDYSVLLCEIDKLVEDASVSQPNSKEEAVVSVTEETEVTECCGECEGGCCSEEEWVTVKRAAEMMECTVPNMYAHVNSKHVVSEKRGRSTMVLVASMGELLRKRAEKKAKKLAKAAE